MGNFILPLYITMTLHLQDGVQSGAQWMRQKRAAFHDRGASALEYAGVVVVGAAIIGFIAWAINQTDVGKEVKSGIEGILKPDIKEKK